MKPLSTNAGFNAWAVLIPLNGILMSMPDGTGRTILLALSYLAIMITGWATKGSGLTKDEGNEILDMKDDINDILSDGRK